MKDRRREDRGLDLAAVRATTEELLALIEPIREEQRHMAELLEQLHDELSTQQGSE